MTPDFTDAERWIVQSACNERWYKDHVALHAADVELQLEAGSTALTECPALFWQVDNCGFVIIKTGSERFRCRFFYEDDLEQYGTGVTEYDDIADCAVALLRGQADHQSVRSGAYPKS